MANFVEDTINQDYQAIAKQWVADPIGADGVINDLVIANVGNPPFAPFDYYKRCTDGNFWTVFGMQTCEERFKLRNKTLAALTDYYQNKYLPLRQSILASILTSLQQHTTDRHKLKLSFQHGQQALRFDIEQQTRKIENLVIFEEVFWAVASSIPEIGKFALIARTVIDKFYQNNSVNTTYYQFNRFMPEPPEITDSNNVSSKQLQFDHVRIIMINSSIAEEHLQMYYTLFPEERPKEDTPQLFTSIGTKEIAIGLFIAVCLYLALTSD